MIKLRQFAGAGFLILSICFALSVVAAHAGEDSDAWIGKEAPSFSLKDLDGKEVKLADIVGSGKVVWINFWGLRCGPCVRELPALEKIYNDYKAKGLVLLAINTDGVDSAFIRNQFAQRPDLKPIAVTFPMLPDSEFSVIDAYGLEGAPLNVMVDSKGIIRFRHEGYEDGDEVKYTKVLKELLAK